MYLDELPELMLARTIKRHGRGRAIRENGRAAAVVWLSDGKFLPEDWLVRFDVAEHEDPARRLSDALTITNAKALWFYGGDSVAWRAVTELGLQLTPQGAVAVRNHDATRATNAITLRPPSALDRLSTRDIIAEYAPGFGHPTVLFAEHKSEVVGAVFSEALDATWTEVRAFVFPAHRGHGFASTLLALHADQLEASGRLVCCAFSIDEIKSRAALESAGFRVADYYFSARRARVTGSRATAETSIARPAPVRA